MADHVFRADDLGATTVAVEGSAKVHLAAVASGGGIYSDTLCGEPVIYGLPAADGADVCAKCRKVADARDTAPAKPARPAGAESEAEMMPAAASAIGETEPAPADEETPRRARK